MYNKPTLRKLKGKQKKNALELINLIDYLKLSSFMIGPVNNSHYLEGLSRYAKDLFNIK